MILNIESTSWIFIFIINLIFIIYEMTVEYENESFYMLYTYKLLWATTKNNNIHSVDY